MDRGFIAALKALTDPTRHYQLTVNVSEMTTVEREAQAVSVDDIEIDA